MWNNAPALRGVANLLFGISLVLLLYGATRYVLWLPAFPLNAVQLKSPPKQVPVDMIERLVHEQIRGNFFTVDLNRTRLAFERLPWVRRVSVRRKFPWRLEVELEEHVALARWNGMALVNTQGEVFNAQTGRSLPVFIGQADTARQMAEMFAEFSKQIRPLQQEITQLSLSPRFAWQVRLSGGMVLELGREQMRQRLARFVAVYPYSLDKLAHEVKRVDLRYHNGFAVHLPNGLAVQNSRNKESKV